MQKYGRMLPIAPFMPSVEVSEEGAVIPRSPVKLMNEIEPVPIIFGVCEKEAVFGFVGKFFALYQIKYMTRIV